jgi:hypothetical protein
MNISGIVGPQAQVQAPASVDKRAQLQAMLLRKSLEMQQAETVAVMQQAEGKGQHIDLRV